MVFLIYIMNGFIALYLTTLDIEELLNELIHLMFKSNV